MTNHHGFNLGKHSDKQQPVKKTTRNPSSFIRCALLGMSEVLKRKQEWIGPPQTESCLLAELHNHTSKAEPSVSSEQMKSQEDFKEDCKSSQKWEESVGWRQWEVKHKGGSRAAQYVQRIFNTEGILWYDLMIDAKRQPWEEIDDFVNILHLRLHWFVLS